MRNNRELQIKSYNDYLKTDLSITQTDRIMRLEQITKTLICMKFKDAPSTSFFWFNNDGKWHFQYCAATNRLWCSFVNIWNILHTEFSIGAVDISNLIYFNLPLLDNELLKNDGYKFNTKTTVACGEDSDYLYNLYRNNNETRRI